MTTLFVQYYNIILVNLQLYRRDVATFFAHYDFPLLIFQLLSHNNVTASPHNMTILVCVVTWYLGVLTSWLYSWSLKPKKKHRFNREDPIPNVYEAEHSENESEEKGKGHGQQRPEKPVEAQLDHLKCGVATNPHPVHGPSGLRLSNDIFKAHLIGKKQKQEQVSHHYFYRSLIVTWKQCEFDNIYIIGKTQSFLKIFFSILIGKMYSKMEA